jgi:hypothetical protein
MVEGKLLEGVEVNNIVGLLHLAETYNAIYLSEFCLNFIAREYDEVMKKVYLFIYLFFEVYILTFCREVKKR